MRHLLTLIFFLSLSIVPACATDTAPLEDVPQNEMDSLPFLDREVAGILDNKAIDEASGLVASVAFPGYLWTHNDSGDEARLFLLNASGKTIAQVNISGASNRDWEDIAIDYNPETQKSTLLVADIGDNKAQYDYVSLYFIEEPAQLITKDTLLPVIKKMILRYPDGRRDAETLMVDPLTHDIYIMSKREPQVALYSITYPYPEKDTLELTKVLTLPHTKIVAGDISPDGKEILIKDYDFIYYYKRNLNESIAQALAKEPVQLSYTREPQGESICFSLDQLYFFTLSEKSPLGITPVLYRYPRK